MSTPTELAQQVIDAYNKQDFDTYEKCLHEDLDFTHFNRGGPISKRDEAMAIVKQFAPLIPDRCFQTPERVTASGNVVVREAYWGGTPTIDLPGMAKAGEKFSIKLCSVMRFDSDGLVVEWKDYG